jgi:hypothetical protein
VLRLQPMRPILFTFMWSVLLTPNELKFSAAFTLNQI